MNIKEFLKRNSVTLDNPGQVIPNADESEHKEELVADGNIVQMVSFTLDDVEYGINILSVHEILRMPDITRLPNSPSYIRGVINLRGNVIPVVDVRERFGLPDAVITPLTRIIVIEVEERLVGLLVDNVYQVVRVPDKNIDPPSELIEGVSEDFIKGIARHSNRLIIMLSLGKLLFSEA
jgi:purine-binding chemotaxis protein CheW